MGDHEPGGGLEQNLGPPPYSGQKPPLQLTRYAIVDVYTLCPVKTNPLDSRPMH